MIDDGVDMEKSGAWLRKQQKWMQNMIQTHPNDPYWRHVSYVVEQFVGLYEGFAAAASPDWVSRTPVLLLQCRTDFSE